MTKAFSYLLAFAVLTGSLLADVRVDHSTLELNGKRYLLIVAVETDDATGAVLRVEQRLVPLDDDDDDDDYDLPTFRMISPARSLNGRLPSKLADIDAHAHRPARFPEHIIWAHETTHKIDGEWINNIARERNVDARTLHTCYCLDGKLWVYTEPKGTLSGLIRYVPPSLKKDRLQTYLVSQQRYFENRPLYVLEEWSAYINGTEVSEQSNEWHGTDDIFAPIEMGIYAMTVPWAYAQQDNEIRAFMRYQWERALGAANRTKDDWAARHLQALASSDDARSLRAWITTYFGKHWTQNWFGWAETNRSLAFSSRKPRPAVEPDSIRSRGYPVRGGWWTFPGSTRLDLLYHMMQGEHAGKYEWNWLKTLNYSELRSLHSDDHENRVQWQYVRRCAPTVRRQILQNQRLTSPRMAPAFCPT